MGLPGGGSPSTALRLFTLLLIASYVLGSVEEGLDFGGGEGKGE